MNAAAAADITNSNVNTLGTHFTWKWKYKLLSCVQFFATPTDYSPSLPSSSVHGILQVNDKYLYLILDQKKWILILAQKWIISIILGQFPKLVYILFSSYLYKVMVLGVSVCVCVCVLGKWEQKTGREVV